MHIILNGKDKIIDKDISLANIVKEVSLSTEFVIAELNGKIIKRQQWRDVLLSDGDVLELVTIVGGG